MLTAFSRIASFVASPASGVEVGVGEGVGVRTALDFSSVPWLSTLSFSLFAFSTWFVVTCDWLISSACTV